MASTMSVQTTTIIPAGPLVTSLIPQPARHIFGRQGLLSYGDTSILDPVTLSVSSISSSSFSSSSFTSDSSSIPPTPAENPSSISSSSFSPSSSTSDSSSTPPTPADTHSSSDQTTATSSSTYGPYTSGSSTITTVTGTNTAPTFAYTQIFNRALKPYNAPEVNQANFSSLCPNGNCFDACHDYGLLFNKDFYNFSSTAQTNTSFSDDGISLFGLCTNVANITNSIINTDSLPNAAPYFQSQEATQYQVNNITSGVAQCLFGTCQATRKPWECDPLCSTFLLQETVTTLNFKNMYRCITKLCDNTCGLPYANQDVFGIGVLISCLVQVVIILAYTAFCLVRTFLPSGPGHKERGISKRINIAAGAFLVAQCFFAVSADIAAFRLGVTSIDPIVGYALLFISTIGLIPPVFTLLLLRSQKQKEWYHTCLVLLSWSLSTVLFFMLIIQLKDVGSNAQKAAEARNNLFSVDACGSYSAMSLCQETGKVDPIHYMMEFYNSGSVPNINTIGVLWGYSFILLLVIFGKSLLRYASRIIAGKRGRTRTHHGKPRPLWRKIVLVVTLMLFVFATCYQIAMVIKYAQMDLVDLSSKGWTFGQIVAVLLWAPFLFELTIGPALEKIKEKLEPDSGKTSGYASSTTSTTNSSAYKPIGQVATNEKLSTASGNHQSNPSTSSQAPESFPLLGSTPAQTPAQTPYLLPPLSPHVTLAPPTSVRSTSPDPDNEAPVSPVEPLRYR